MELAKYGERPQAIVEQFLAVDEKLSAVQVPLIIFLPTEQEMAIVEAEKEPEVVVRCSEPRKVALVRRRRDMLISAPFGERRHWEGSVHCSLRRRSEFRTLSVIHLWASTHEQ